MTKIIQNLKDEVKDRLSKRSELNKEIKVIRDKAHREATLAYEEARAEALVKEAKVRAMEDVKRKKAPILGGGSMTGMFEGFRDVATDFTRRQESEKKKQDKVSKKKSPAKSKPQLSDWHLKSPYD